MEWRTPMTSRRNTTWGLSLCAALLIAATAAGATPTVQADKPGAKINPAMWGIFFEDINLGADGGLYAELVKNRSFEFPNAMMGWLPSVRVQDAKLPSLNPISESNADSMQIHTDDPFDPQSPHYLRITS